LFAVLSALVMTISASAEPPPGVNPNSDLAKWFKSLKDSQGIPCCDISDCRRVEARLADGYYEALINQIWARVPEETIRKVENPTGQYIACYSYYDYSQQYPHIFCFVPISLANSVNSPDTGGWRS
jgi:hypothetical protein